MSEPLQCEIVTPEHRLFSGEATFVVVPGTEGEMGVYAKHSPQVTTLGTGCIKVVSNDSETGAESATRIAAMGGYLEITGEKVIVLANRAMMVDDADAAEVAAAIAEQTEVLASLGADDPGRFYAQLELTWNNLLQSLMQKAE